MEEGSFIIALAGNPNVGKSTVFNSLTGLKQHTGNWTGKTVDNASGEFKVGEEKYTLVDIPGTYSLMSHSVEEQIARDFILFGNAKKVLVVCDGTNLERNLNLCLQIMEIHPNVCVCVNLLDEAVKRKIKIDLKGLSNSLNAPVFGTVARKQKNAKEIKENLIKSSESDFFAPDYPETVKKAIFFVKPVLMEKTGGKINPSWLSLQMILDNREILEKAGEYCGVEILKDKEILSAKAKSLEYLKAVGVNNDCLEDMVAYTFSEKAEEICKSNVSSGSGYSALDRKLDRLFTGKFTGVAVMLVLLCFVLWITVSGANYISDWLSRLLSSLETGINLSLNRLGAGENFRYIVTEGLLRVPFWVTAVMLPPMLLFFPLFTYLEDLGYLPRVAFNLDKPFNRCKGCGKQALTMCMGLGCNAVGVTGCRIIDSKRERLLATLTNTLVPCNGRFPAIVTIISVFIVTVSGFWGEVLASVTLTAFIVLGILATFLMTKLLSKTLLKGESMPYILEMPSYRRPQLGKIIIRSVKDRVIFVFGRALCVALPAGIVIFVLANIEAGNGNLLNAVADFLDPFASLLGLDGMILLAFILGLPANEIVLPIILMGYLSGNTLTEIPDLNSIREILISNGWSVKTAVCTLIFSLFHWPCSTTLLSIKKETGSFKWTAVAFALPTVLGILLCMAVNLVFNLLTQNP